TNRSPVSLLEWSVVALRHVRPVSDGAAIRLSAPPGREGGRALVYRHIPRDLARLRRAVAPCLEAAAVGQSNQPEEGRGCAGHQAISLRAHTLRGSIRAVVRLRSLEYRDVFVSADSICALGTAIQEIAEMRHSSRAGWTALGEHDRSTAAWCRDDDRDLLFGAIERSITTLECR